MDGMFQSATLMLENGAPATPTKAYFNQSGSAAPTTTTTTTTAATPGDSVYNIGKVGIAPWGDCPGFKPDAQWIWISDKWKSAPGNGSNNWVENPPKGSEGTFYFNYNNTGNEISNATINMIVDNRAKVYKNDEEISGVIGGGWGTSGKFINNITISPGENIFKFVVQNLGSSPNPAGLLVHAYDENKTDLFYTGMDGWYHGQLSEAPPPPAASVATTTAGSATTTAGSAATTQTPTSTVTTNTFPIPSATPAPAPFNFEGSGILPVSQLISPDTYNPISSSAPQEDQTKSESDVFHAIQPSIVQNLDPKSVVGDPIYYQPGTVKYKGLGYTPSYSEMMYLNNHVYKSTPETINQSGIKGFCNHSDNIMNNIDEKCKTLPNDVCAATECCVLFGGEKCVEGDNNGPKNKMVYSNTSIKNRDVYYYQGDCYGNCPANTQREKLKNSNNYQKEEP
tara:strand:+ start:239 stop:1597 length:1359 start_codon:yes stop_codon:yes gene_type:complete